jgi:hypothetical protein
MLSNFLSPSLTSRLLRELGAQLAPEADSLNKASCLAPALCVAKFITISVMSLVTLCCTASLDLDFQENHNWDYTKNLVYPAKYFKKQVL